MPYRPTGLVAWWWHGPGTPCEHGPVTERARVRVVIADDHPLVREGTRKILAAHADLDVVAEVSKGEEVASVVEETSPDVLLLDLRLPGMSGLEVLRHLVAQRARVKVIILSAFAEREYVTAALAGGAAGYLLKTASGEEVAAGIRAVVSGATVLDPAVSMQLLGAPAAQKTVEMTPRESVLVALVAEGLPNKAIAARLGISPRTVDGHLSRLFSKLGVATRTELARYAVTHDLLGSPEP